MANLSWPADDDSLLALVWSWVDVLAEEDYDTVYQEIGYLRAFGEGAAAIRRDIESYRDAVYFPGETKFRVTNRRLARDGNPDPKTLIRRYVPIDSLPILATIEIDLPLNGKWSRLEADFVVFEIRDTLDEAAISLEDISSLQVETQ